ncbi:MAG: two-component system LytT family response regulator [Flavobacteriales bacterium]|jgi:two-component system LytT family response regulator
MRTIIIDDEQDACINLTAFLERFCPEIKVIGTANDIDAGEALIIQENPSLVFLDIQMPGGSGFQLLERFGERNFHFIFTTSYHEFALKAIKVSALDYLLKPIDSNELKKAVKKALSSQTRMVKERLITLDNNFDARNGQQIAIKTNKGLQMILTHDIVCCEADGRYVYFHTLGQNKIMASQNLKHYQQILEAFGFIRVHHSFMLNIKHIREYRNDSKIGRGGVVITNNGMEIPVSLRRKKILVSYLSRFTINDHAHK